MSEIGGSAGAGNPGGAGGAAGTGDGGAAAGGKFFDSFQNADVKGWVANKGFESPEVMAQSYLNLEKLFGHDKAGRTVVLPDDKATPEDRAAFLTKLGRPEKPEGYEMPKEGIDPKLADWARGAFHKAGIPAGMAKEFVAEWQQFVTGEAESQKTATEARFTEETNGLKKEWGAAFDDKCKIVDRACAEFGLSADDLQAIRGYMGPARAMKLLESIGSKLGEASFITGDDKKGFGGALTPAQAQAEIKSLRSDAAFAKRYTAGDHEARAKMEQLHKWAYPEG